MKDSEKQTAPPMKRMLCLQVIIRNADKFEGKNITDLLFSLYKEHDISGATAWTGSRGYGSRGVSSFSLPELATKIPIIIETVAEPEKIRALLGRVKQIVGDRGLITFKEVSVL